MIFDKNFFPTPDPVIETMLIGLDLKNKHALEPSAGKGDIVKKLVFYGAKTTICELNEDLAKVSSTYSNRFLKPDFFNVVAEEVSHIDYIFMNPPFDKADKHILHAWEVAPEGCTIVALCNWETVNNTYSFSRKELYQLVSEHGSKQNLGNCFSTAERKTDVQIGLIKLFKPKTGENEFDGYFDLCEDYEEYQGEGIMKYNAIKDIVNRYVEAVKKFDATMEVANELNALIEPIKANTILFGAKWTGERNGSYNDINRDIFKKELQKSAWKEVFSRMKLDKYLTKSVMSDINKFVETQEKVPFTMTNIYKMFEMIIGTREGRFKEIIIKAFDEITSRTHKNRFSREGWKTNSEYVVNKKFIMGSRDFKMNFSGRVEASYDMNSSGYFMDDITKALCFVTGSNIDDCNGWREFTNRCKVRKVKYEQKIDNYTSPRYGEVVEYERDERYDQGLEYGKWHEFNFLRIKMFKKGSMHCEFLSNDVWVKFNQTAAKTKGFQLASKFTGDFKVKKTDLQKV